MAKDLILTKESSEREIKAYFNAVLKLSQSDNEFPINLDDVWPLVYSRKQEAVRSLKDGFMESVDYQAVRKNAQQDLDNTWGGSNKVDYFLTLPCMEFFIARKVRPVFDVYRKVFHGTAKVAIEQNRKPKREPSLTTKVRVGLEWVKGVSEMLNLNDPSKLLLLGKIAEPLDLPLPEYTSSKGVLCSVTELIKKFGMKFSAKAFNKKMKESGIMEDRTRPSSKGGEKHFNLIIGKGLEFGENSVHPEHQNQTQPRYYEDKFKELVSLLNIA